MTITQTSTSPQFQDFSKFLQNNSSGNIVLRGGNLQAKGALGSFFAGKAAHLATNQAFANSIRQQYGDSFSNALKTRLDALESSNKPLSAREARDILGSAMYEQAKMAGGLGGKADTYAAFKAFAFSTSGKYIVVNDIKSDKNAVKEIELKSTNGTISKEACLATNQAFVASIRQQYSEHFDCPNGGHKGETWQRLGAITLSLMSQENSNNPLTAESARNILLEVEDAVRATNQSVSAPFLKGAETDDPNNILNKSLADYAEKLGGLNKEQTDKIKAFLIEEIKNATANHPIESPSKWYLRESPPKWYRTQGALRDAIADGSFGGVKYMAFALGKSVKLDKVGQVDLLRWQTPLLSDLARLYKQVEGDNGLLNKALYFAKLGAMREIQPEGAITANTLWKACLGTTLPQNLHGKSMPEVSQAVEKELLKMLADKGNEWSKLKGRGNADNADSRVGFAQLAIQRGVKLEVCMAGFTENMRMDTNSFFITPNLYDVHKLPSHEGAKTQIAKDLARGFPAGVTMPGVSGIGSIYISPPTTESKDNAPFMAEAIMVGIEQLCEGNEKQARVAQMGVCQAGGDILSTCASVIYGGASISGGASAAGEQEFRNKSTRFTLDITRQNNGDLHLTYSTLPDSPMRVQATYAVSPDGSSRLIDLVADAKPEPYAAFKAFASSGSTGNVVVKDIETGNDGSVKSIALEARDGAVSEADCRATRQAFVNGIRQQYGEGFVSGLDLNSIENSNEPLSGQTVRELMAKVEEAVQSYGHEIASNMMAELHKVNLKPEDVLTIIRKNIPDNISLALKQEILGKHFFPMMNSEESWMKSRLNELANFISSPQASNVMMLLHQTLEADLREKTGLEGGTKDPAAKAWLSDIKGVRNTLALTMESMRVYMPSLMQGGDLPSTDDDALQSLESLGIKTVEKLLDESLQDAIKRPPETFLRGNYVGVLALRVEAKSIFADVSKGIIDHMRSSFKNPGDLNPQVEGLRRDMLRLKFTDDKVWRALQSGIALMQQKIRPILEANEDQHLVEKIINSFAGIVILGGITAHASNEAQKNNDPVALEISRFIQKEMKASNLSDRGDDFNSWGNFMNSRIPGWEQMTAGATS